MVREALRERGDVNMIGDRGRRTYHYIVSKTDNAGASQVCQGIIPRGHSADVGLAELGPRGADLPTKLARAGGESLRSAGNRR